MSGTGARLFGGRWNRSGIPCVYTSGSLSLGVLEYAVNNSLYHIPRALSCSVYDIPHTGHKKLKVAALPGDWTSRPVPVSTMDFGSRLLAEKKHLIIAVPSVIIPGEYNFLINPLHQDIIKVRLVGIEDFVFDVRLKA
jgi:RES domain-containing protein